MYDSLAPRARRGVTATHTAPTCQQVASRAPYVIAGTTPSRGAFDAARAGARARWIGVTPPRLRQASTTIPVYRAKRAIFAVCWRGPPKAASACLQLAA